MTGDEEVVPDNPEGGTGDKGEGGGEAGGGEPKLFFGKFKSEEEAEKAYKEAEKKISQQGQTLAERDTRMRDLEETANLAKTIELLAQRKPDDGKATNDDYDKYIAQLAEEATTDPAGATKKIVALMGKWTADAEQRSTKHAETRLSTLETRMASLLDQVQQSVERLDPAYQKDKAVIDSLVAKGMSLKAAREWVADLEGRDDAPLQRPRPPAGPPAGGGKGGGGGWAQPWALSAKEKAAMKTDDGFTDADIAGYELERKQEYEKELAEKARREQQ